jgi:type IV pilus assembly protein PilM
MGEQYSRLSVGLDIGSSLIKLVALSRNAEGWALANIALASLPAGAIVDGDVMDSGAVADSIEDLFRQLGLEENRVISAISGRAVIVKPIRIPTVEDDELAQNVSWEAEQYLPSLADVNLDYHVIGREDDYTRVLLVAAKKERLENHLMILRLAGLEPLIVDVDSFALGNCYELAEPAGAADTVALVNIGAALTNINVLAAGSPRFTRDVSIAGNDFTEAVARDLALSVADAERAKRGENHEIDPAALNAVLERVAEELVGEIGRTLSHFFETNPDLELQRAVLTGGSSGLPQITEALQVRLAVPVTNLDPLANLDTAASGLDPDELAALAPHLAVGVGLAIRGDDPELP